MVKNLIPLITKELGVEIGEEFETNHCQGTFRFTENCLEWKCDGEVGTNGQWETCRGGVSDIVCGEAKIVKLPFKPKHLEGYYTYENYSWDVVEDYWEGTMGDYALQIACCVFRTKEEAEKARPEIYKRLTGKDWAKRGDEDA